MAEENPHIEIKQLSRPIDNTRAQYLFENENLILGRPGFIFRSYPTLKERLQGSLNEQKEYNYNTSKASKNSSLGKIGTKHLIKNNSSIFDKSYMGRNEKKLLKSRTQTNLLSQPILRFKNRTDLERICDTIQQYVKPNEQEKLKEIRARHVHSIDFPTGILYKGGFKDLKKFKKMQTKSLDNKIHFSDDGKAFNVEGKNKPIIFFTRLQRLNVEAKKIRSILHFKTHFKGVESVFINPKQISDTIKKGEKLNDQTIGSYAYNEQLEKEAIEKRNEYKEDMRNILLEDSEKQRLINSKEFSNYLNNKVFYNDPAVNINKKTNQEEKIKQINNMNYLKKLAFEDNGMKTSNGSQESGNNNTDSSNEGNIKNKKNVNMENEHELRIGGKLFHMKNEMGKIAREILNKCKYYTYRKEE
jgi:hypothetical protein